jgi:hypothetical protein
MRFSVIYGIAAKSGKSEGIISHIVNIGVQPVSTEVQGYATCGRWTYLD